MDLHPLPDTDNGQVGLVDVQFYPDRGEIGDREEHITHIDVLPLLDHFLDDHP